MSRSLSFSAGLFFSLALLLCPAVQADIVIGNLPATADASNGIGPGSGIDEISFGWTTTQDFILDSIDLGLDFTVAGVGSAIVELRRGALPSVATTETFLSLGAEQLGAGIFNATPVTPVVLEAGENYWVTISGPNSNQFGWQFNQANVEPTGTFATSLGYRFNSGDFVGTLNNFVQVNGSAVPEPASVFVLGMSALGLAVRRRRA